jgi:DNA-binding transcriptional regulator LsrR (DeoR family)
VPAPREPGDLVRTARLYYQEGLSQAQVAERLGTSRSNVSRMLTAALEQGIVEIRIHDLSGRRHDLEDRLRETFGLREARVAAVGQLASATDTVGSVAAELLLEVLDDAATIAFSWGHTLQAVAWALETDRSYDVRFCQVAGGLSSLSNEVSGQELVREFASRTGGTYELIHAPVALETADAAMALMSEPSIAGALRAAAEADAVFFGIGAPAHGSSASLLQSMRLDPMEEKAFWDAHPVGDLAARYYDIDGQPVPVGYEDRVVALGLDAIAAIPLSVGVAAGRIKTRAVLGALRGGYLDGLVCDEDLAMAVLAEASTTTKGQV